VHTDSSQSLTAIIHDLASPTDSKCCRNSENSTRSPDARQCVGWPLSPGNKGQVSAVPQGCETNVAKSTCSCKPCSMAEVITIRLIAQKCEFHTCQQDSLIQLHVPQNLSEQGKEAYPPV
jgi:hypothetical protein